MNNPLEPILSPLAQSLPSEVKLDGTIQAIVLYFYLTYYTNLTQTEIFYILAVAGATHYAIHDIACKYQLD